MEALKRDEVVCLSVDSVEVFRLALLSFLLGKLVFMEIEGECHGTPLINMFNL